MQNLHQLEYIMLLLIGSIVLGFGLAQISLKIAPKVGLMDIPGSPDHKKHQNPIPLTGGVVLMDTMIVMILLTKMWGDAHIWAIFVSGMIIGLFGLMDDYFHLSVTKKLIGQIFGITMLIYLGVQVQFFNSPEFLLQIEEPWASWLNIIFTFLWLLTVTNSFNFIDSIDGLAVGLSGVSAGFFLLLAFATGQMSLIFLCTVILGICIALYLFNSQPASLFLGDSGAQFLGFLLASVAIIYHPEIGSQGSSWFMPILIFSVPLFDMILVVFSRIKRHKKIHKASRDHTYHRLEQRGIPIHHSVLIMHGTSLLLSMIGFLCLNLPVLHANIIFGLIVLLGLGAFTILDQNYQ